MVGLSGLLSKFRVWPRRITTHSFGAGALFAALASTAQAFIDPPVVHPAAPTDATPITLTMRYGECDALLDHTVDPRGSYIEVTIVKETRAPPDCDAPEAEYEIALGLLPPGQYSVGVYLRDSEPPGAPPTYFDTALFTVVGSVAYFSDLEVELIATPSEYLPPGTEGRVTARFTNHGPDVADRALGRTPHVVQFSPEVPYEIYLGSFTTCDVWFQTFSPWPGDPLSASMNYSLHEPLAVGETRECVIGFDAKPFATGTFTLQVEVRYGGTLN